MIGATVEFTYRRVAASPYHTHAIPTPDGHVVVQRVGLSSFITKSRGNVYLCMEMIYFKLDQALLV